VGNRIDAAGAAHLVLAQGGAQLDPARAVFDGMLAGWCEQQRGHGRSHSTIRGYHDQLGLFVAFVCDRRYGWVEECEQRIERRRR
jgi:hypothetical protein